VWGGRITSEVKKQTKKKKTVDRLHLNYQSGVEPEIIAKTKGGVAKGGNIKGRLRVSTYNFQKINFLIFEFIGG